MATTTNLTTLKINYLTEAQYNTALSNNQINENELYLTPDTGGGGSALTPITNSEIDSICV